MSGNKMGSRRSTYTSSRLSRPTSLSDVHLLVRGVPFTFDWELLAARSAKLASLIKQSSREDLLKFLGDIPADHETFELVARFCHGFELQLSTENVVPLACLACYLEMSETHSENNLLRKTLTFFKKRILPSWNETIKAFRTAENFYQQAEGLGLIDACLESIVFKALTDPHLVGEPIKNLAYEEDREDPEDQYYRPNARKSEDLTTLSLRFYELVIREMIHRGIPSENVAASIYQYAKKWAFPSTLGREHASIFIEASPQREVVEAVARLLPRERGVLPCTQLFELLRLAIVLEASFECRNGLETRIGKQLDQATVKDLLIPSQGYAKEVQYDIECIRRILKHFYANYNSTDVSGFITVALLIEELLLEVASDNDLKMQTFIKLAEMSISASLALRRSSDGMYRAIDVYLDKHKYLTEREREEVCEVLDCQKLSTEASEHAAQNKKLPLRVVIQVLFMGQLQIREMIPKEAQVSNERLRIGLEDEEEEKDQKEKAKTSPCDEQVRTEMEKMSNKVMELERECYMMRKEMENSSRHKGSVWKEMKRKLGCTSSIHDCNCQVKKKKVHPK